MERRYSYALAALLLTITSTTGAATTSMTATLDDCSDSIWLVAADFPNSFWQHQASARLAGHKLFSNVRGIAPKAWAVQLYRDPDLSEPLNGSTMENGTGFRSAWSADDSVKDCKTKLYIRRDFLLRVVESTEDNSSEAGSISSATLTCEQKQQIGPDATFSGVVGRIYKKGILGYSLPIWMFTLSVLATFGALLKHAFTNNDRYFHPQACLRAILPWYMPILFALILPLWLVMAIAVSMPGLVYYNLYHLDWDIVCIPIGGGIAVSRYTGPFYAIYFLTSAFRSWRDPFELVLGKLGLASHFPKRLVEGLTVQKVWLLEQLVDSYTEWSIVLTTHGKVHLYYWILWLVSSCVSSLIMVLGAVLYSLVTSHENAHDWGLERMQRWDRAWLPQSVDQQAARARVCFFWILVVQFAFEDTPQACLGWLMLTKVPRMMNQYVLYSLVGSSIGVVASFRKLQSYYGCGICGRRCSAHRSILAAGLDIERVPWGDPQYVLDMGTEKEEDLSSSSSDDAASTSATLSDVVSKP